MYRNIEYRGKNKCSTFKIKRKFTKSQILNL